MKNALFFAVLRSSINTRFLAYFYFSKLQGECLDILFTYYLFCIRPQFCYLAMLGFTQNWLDGCKGLKMPRWIVHILWIWHPPPVICTLRYQNLQEGLIRCEDALTGSLLLLVLHLQTPCLSKFCTKFRTSWMLSIEFYFIF